MKVKELIKELKKHNPESECVGFQEHCSGYSFSFVSAVCPIKINQYGDEDEKGTEVIYLSVF